MLIRRWLAARCRQLGRWLYPDRVPDADTDADKDADTVDAAVMKMETTAGLAAVGEQLHKPGNVPEINC